MLLPIRFAASTSGLPSHSDQLPPKRSLVAGDEMLLRVEVVSDVFSQECSKDKNSIPVMDFVRLVNTVPSAASNPISYSRPPLCIC